DRGGQPLLTNTEYERMFGRASPAIIFCDEAGHPLPESETPQRRAARGDAFRTDFTVRGESEGKHSERRTFEVNGGPVGSDGDRLGGVLVIRDITERTIHRLQEGFLELASHELRTPLTPMRTALQSLLSHLDTDGDVAKQRRLAEIALGQTRRLARLVDDLLDATRLQSGKYTITREPLTLDELVARTVETARGLSEKHELRLTIESSPLPINGDAGRLEQVIWNLLTNAITHAPDSEHIDISLRRVDDHAELRVRDYGPGIAAEEIPRLFTRFFQVPLGSNGTHRGLGLGLYISREIVQAHEGQITVDSTLGQGTTFTARLPLA
ncbi:MAG TPA: ATP-binding protein, partial [Ktedonobacterales bacterium]